jgi:hypothetical protein
MALRGLDLTTLLNSAPAAFSGSPSLPPESDGSDQKETPAKPKEKRTRSARDWENVDTSLFTGGIHSGNTEDQL